MVCAVQQDMSTHIFYLYTLWPQPSPLVASQLAVTTSTSGSGSMMSPTSSRLPTSAAFLSKL